LKFETDMWDSQLGKFFRRGFLQFSENPK